MFCPRLAVVEGKWGSDADADKAERRFAQRLSRCRAGLHDAAVPEAWRQPGTRLAQELAAPAGRRGRRGPEDDDLRFEAALQRQKDSKGSAQPLNRREAFRAVWRERRWGSDADADLAEQRFKKRLSKYRAGLRAAAAWLLPGSRLAEALEL
jgi:hypothetical protein